MCEIFAGVTLPSLACSRLLAEFPDPRPPPRSDSTNSRAWNMPSTVLPIETSALRAGALLLPKTCTCHHVPIQARQKT